MDRDRKETLTELLEWRRWLPGWKYRLPEEYLKELHRLCAKGCVEVIGRPAVFRRDGEPQPFRLVPPKAFDDGQLVKGGNTNRGELRVHGRLGPVAQWTDLRFSSNTCRVWETALKAGEIRAPRASSPLSETAQPIPAALAETGAPAPEAANPQREYASVAPAEAAISEPEAAEPIPTVPAKPPRGKPGPPRDVRNALRDKMLTDLISRRRTLEQLRKDTHSALWAEYGGSPNTAKLARDDAIAEYLLRVAQSSAELGTLSNSEH